MDTKSKFESYRLGIDDIDEQHRTLFDYIENPDAAIASGDRWLVVYQTPAELEHWAKMHFAVEESLCASAAGPVEDRPVLRVGSCAV